MRAVSQIFTDTEKRILDIYVRKERREVMRDIETALPLVTDPELNDNCKSLINKLKDMEDQEFDNLAW
jgi:hypothetical protein